MARAQGRGRRWRLCSRPSNGTAPATGFRTVPFDSTMLGSEQPLIASELLGQGRDPLTPIKDAVQVAFNLRNRLEAAVCCTVHGRPLLAQSGLLYKNYTALTITYEFPVSSSRARQISTIEDEAGHRRRLGTTCVRVRAEMLAASKILNPAGGRLAETRRRP